MRSTISGFNTPAGGKSEEDIGARDDVPESAS